MSSSKRAAAAVLEEDVVPLFQHNLPEHFILKVESFSSLKLEKYESDEFEVDGHKWRLILYPNGDKRRNGDNHISLYLSISDTNNLPQGWEVKAYFTLFVYNFVSDKYLTFQGSARRFYWLKRNWGFIKLLELDYFKEVSNGYLFEDKCVFGAEVSVIRTSVVPKVQCLSLLKETNIKIFSWKIDKFSAIKEEYIQSDKFKIGNFQWKLKLYPKGWNTGKGKDISLFLKVLEDESITASAYWRVNVDFILRIRNQANSNHHEKQTTGSLSMETRSWGFCNFLPLKLVNRKRSEFIVNDTLIVEAEIRDVGTYKNFKWKALNEAC